MIKATSTYKGKDEWNKDRLNKILLTIVFFCGYVLSTQTIVRERGGFPPKFDSNISKIVAAANDVILLGVVYIFYACSFHVIYYFRFSFIDSRVAKGR